MLSKDRLCHFFYKKQTKKYYGAKFIFRSFPTFFGPTIFDPVPKKDQGYYLLTAGQFVTILQEFRLWGS